MVTNFLFVGIFVSVPYMHCGYRGWPERSRGWGGGGGGGWGGGGGGGALLSGVVIGNLSSLDFLGLS